MKSPDKPDPLTVQQVADIAQVQDETVRNWIKRGWVTAIQLPGGSYRIPRCEVDRLLRHKAEEESW